MKISEIPSWTFRVDEVSSNVYKITGRDSLGRGIELVGFDPDDLIKECRSIAVEMDKKTV
jgi:hypothetical protein